MQYPPKVLIAAPRNGMENVEDHIDFAGMAHTNPLSISRRPEWKQKS